MFFQLYTEEEKSSNIAKEIHTKLYKLSSKISDINNRFTRSINTIKDKNDLIEDFAQTYKINKQHLNRIMEEYFNFGRKARIRTWCKEFSKTGK